ncbi:hypothetical protein B0H14DRAFT_3878122 [Mycena olivaceomarginata]|nr:hypothetical protein B0H14DRAFT_3878122 [Mycena olivaceomarginata]
MVCLPLARSSILKGPMLMISLSKQVQFGTVFGWWYRLCVGTRVLVDSFSSCVRRAALGLVFICLAAAASGFAPFLFFFHCILFIRACCETMRALRPTPNLLFGNL